jgi:hypothetical protein
MSMNFANRHGLTVVLAAAVVVCALSGCLPLKYPRAGEPVSLRPGEALVVGRIRMFALMNRYEFHPFSRNPWDHVLKPDPLVSLELRRHESAEGAFTYKAYPSPVVEDDGSFYWILRTGNYSLLGNPRLLGSPGFDPGETEKLARFTVPGSGETVYVGTLVVSLYEGLFNVVNMGRRGETEYEIHSLSIVDERDEALSKLQERFPLLPKPVTTELMSVE